MKLNQVIAIEKGVKSRTYSEVSELHKMVQKAELFSGFEKAYKALDEEGEQLPPESKKVQVSVTSVLDATRHAMCELISVTARKDYTNCTALADVMLDGRIVIDAAPVSFLLFLEKQLTDMRTLITALPVLDDAEDWRLDPNSGRYRTEPVRTHRTKKTQRPVVLYPATPEHPAQTAMVSEDIIAGYWTSVRFSGAMPRPERQILLERVERLLHAIKAAREVANMADVVGTGDIGAAIFGLLLGTSSSLS